MGNPVRLIDPDGRSVTSTEVRDDGDGNYTVVNASNDNDTGVYVVDSDGNRTGEVIGQTITPFDFMSTNDSDGTFYFDADMSGVSFNINNLGFSGTLTHQGSTDFSSFLSHTFSAENAGQIVQTLAGLYASALQRNGAVDGYSALQTLREMSANGGILDIKVSAGVPKYTAVGLGNGKTITTLRAIGNIAFGNNMRFAKPPLVGENFYYKNVMTKVGAYNQSQNNGNGYNSGAPFYGEHTYSGTFIHLGYYGRLPKQ